MRRSQLGDRARRRAPAASSAVGDALDVAPDVGERVRLERDDARARRRPARRRPARRPCRLTAQTSHCDCVTITSGRSAASCSASHAIDRERLLEDRLHALVDLVARALDGRTSARCRPAAGFTDGGKSHSCDRPTSCSLEAERADDLGAARDERNDARRLRLWAHWNRTFQTCSSESTPTRARPFVPARRRSVEAGKSARSKPIFSASRSRSSTCPTPRTSPVSPTSPDDDVARSARPSRARGDRRDHREIRRGLVDAEAARDVQEHVLVVEPHAQRFSSTASSSATRPRSSPIVVRRGIASAERETSAWISTSTGRLPSSVASTAEPGAPTGPLGEERSRRVRDLGEARSPISNTPTSLVEPKRFFTARSTRSACAAVALEVEDGVDQVLEHARAGERALLRHVADQEAGARRSPCERDEQRRRLAHLADAARRRARARRVQRLDRVDDHGGGRERVDVLDDRLGRRLAARSARRTRRAPSRSARRRTCSGDSSPAT